MNLVRMKTEMSAKMKLYNPAIMVPIYPCPQLHHLCLKGKETVPMHAMQYNVYLLYTKTTESLYLLSVADWAADCGLQED